MRGSPPPKQAHVGTLMAKNPEPPRGDPASTPTQTPVPGETNLKTLALSADEAVKCCESGGTRMAITIQNVISEFLSTLLESDPDEDDGIALVLPGAVLGQIGVDFGIGAEAATVPRIVRLTKGAASRVLGVGVVLLVSGINLGRIARQTGSLESASAILEAVSLLRGKQTLRASCEACVRSKVWNQDSPRRRFALKGGGSVRKRS